MFNIWCSSFSFRFFAVKFSVEMIFVFVWEILPQYICHGSTYTLNPKRNSPSHAVLILLTTHPPSTPAHVPVIFICLPLHNNHVCICELSLLLFLFLPSVDGEEDAMWRRRRWNEGKVGWDFLALKPLHMLIHTERASLSSTFGVCWRFESLSLSWLRVAKLIWSYKIHDKGWVIGIKH